MCGDTFGHSNQPFSQFYFSIKSETFTFAFLFCFKSAVDYDSENGDDDTGDVEGADTDRDENQIEQRHDTAAAPTTRRPPPPNENEIIREHVEVDSRNDFIESNNGVVGATQNGSTTRIDSLCAVNYGGCEQKCTVVQNELTGQDVVACSCGDGYALDIDGTHCIGE